MHTVQMIQTTGSLYCFFHFFTILCKSVGLSCCGTSDAHPIIRSNVDFDCDIIKFSTLAGSVQKERLKGVYYTFRKLLILLSLVNYFMLMVV